MNAFAFALMSILIVVVGHAALLRLIPVRFALLSLVSFVAVVPVALGTILLLGGELITLIDWAVGVLLAISLGLAYALLFVGIVYDSPTLALINAIADCGDIGMSVEELDRFIVRHPFVSSRLESLKETGMLILDGQNWVLRDQFGPLLRLGEAYRALCTRQTTTG